MVRSSYSVELLPLAEALPWVGGTTTPLWVHSTPSPSDPFVFRVSRATVNQSGPFSDFSGYDRTTLLTRGAGIDLAHAYRGSHRLHRLFNPYAYSGDWKTEGTLLDGSVDDFNIFADRSRGRAALKVHEWGKDPDSHLLTGDFHFFHLFDGAAEIYAEGAEDCPLTLHAGNSLLFSPAVVGPFKAGQNLRVKLLGADAVVVGVDFFLKRTGVRFGIVPPAPSSFALHYQPPRMGLWSGRTDSTTDDRAFRIHQVVKRAQILQEADGTLRLEGIHRADGPRHAYALVGFASDEGVRRNHGRQGAAEGPEAIRKALAILPAHFREATLYDVGDIAMSYDIRAGSDPLNAAQMSLSHVIQLLLSHGLFPIILGGGHEVGYAHGHALYEWFKRNRPADVLGISNGDAHFDLRALENGQGTSGTPFFQLAQKCRAEDLPFLYLCLGIQLAANTRLLFDTANELGVGYLFADEIKAADPDQLRQVLDLYLERLDALYLTNCMDVFAAAYAPGVSALNPDGLAPEHYFAAFDHLVRSGKMVSLDVAEVAPRLEHLGRDKQQDNLTARLAARLIHRAMTLRSGDLLPGIALEDDTPTTATKPSSFLYHRGTTPWGMVGRPVPASSMRSAPFLLARR